MPQQAQPQTSKGSNMDMVDSLHAAIRAAYRDACLSEMNEAMDLRAFNEITAIIPVLDPMNIDDECKEMFLGVSIGFMIGIFRQAYREEIRPHVYEIAREISSLPLTIAHLPGAMRIDYTVLGLAIGRSFRDVGHWWLTQNLADEVHAAIVDMAGRDTHKYCVMRDMFHNA